MRKTGLFLLFFAYTGFLHALELGDLNTMSNPGEPFRAEIRVTDLENEKASNIRIGIPSREEFFAAGVPFKEYVSDFLFRFRKLSADTGIIEVRNTQLIRDDDIAFLVSVNWSNGGIIREYSVIQAQTFQEEKITAPDPPVAKPPAIDMDIVVGDTLRNVAKAIYLAHFRITGVTIEQIMTAIRRNNAQALRGTGGRLSYQLQANTVITIPDVEIVRAQSVADAKKEINAFLPQIRHQSPPRRRTINRQPIGDTAQVRLLTDQSKDLRSRVALQEERLAVLAEQRNNFVEQVQSIDTQIIDADNVLSIKNIELMELQQKLSVLQGDANWWDDLLGADPILWSLLAVLAVIVFIVLTMIAFPGRKKSTLYGFESADAAFQPSSAHADMSNQPSKLDLARAFIDMGNLRQAKIILQEVMTYGTPEQQRNARNMLADL